MRRVATVAVILAVGLLGAPAPASLARLTAAASATATAATGSLAAPTALAASAASGVVSLTWTPTVTTSATGYDVLRSTTSGSGYSLVGTVTPRTAATTTNAPGNGSFYYVLRSSLQTWRSPDSVEAAATVGPISTGLQDCASTAADTGGDGNGYQTNAANVCVNDGAVATDANSGTNTNTSCTNSGKDRHRFWGYAFELPTAVSAVNGISVSIRTNINTTGGTNRVCAQLSWNGGTSWTAVKTLTPTTTFTTFTLGGAEDTWGRTWTPAELGTSTFRVRIIDVSSQTTKTFVLDWVRVQVHYTP